jgi:hypothetical protein
VLSPKSLGFAMPMIDWGAYCRPISKDGPMPRIK